MLLFVVILSMILAVFAVAMLYRETTLLKAVTVGLFLYFAAYVFASAGLFFIDLFSIKKAIALAGLLCGALAIVLYGIACYQAKGKAALPTLTIEQGEMVRFVIILCTALPLSFSNFGFFGMTQDQGVYQTKAIELLYGNTQRVFYSEGYDVLETEESQSSYIAALSGVTGYDGASTAYLFISEESISDGSLPHIFHGISTFPAVLALFAKLFGLGHMMDCQTVFYVLFLMMLGYVVEALGASLALSSLAVFVMSLCPEIVWLSKSALTEMFLCLVMASIFLFILEKEKRLQALMVLSIILFSIWHVSVVCLMPAFFAMLWGLYLQKGEKHYLHMAVVTAFGYAAGFIFTLYIAPGYTTNNIIKSLKSVLPITKSNTLAVILLACAGALFVTILLYIFGEKLRNMKKLQKLAALRHWFCRIALLLLLALFAYRYYAEYAMDMEEGITFGHYHLTIVGFAIASAIVMLPLVVIAFFRKSGKNILLQHTFTVALPLLYFVFVYGTVFKPALGYYYYSARYLAPYMAVAVIAFCAFYPRARVWWCVACGAFALWLYHAPLTLLTSVQDDTKVSFRVVEDLLAMTASAADSGTTAVIIDAGEQAKWWLPVSATGCDVFDCWDDLTEEIAFLDERYDTVYVLGGDKDNVEASLYLRYKGLEETYLYRDDERASTADAVTGYCVYYKTRTSYVNLYQYLPEKLYYGCVEDMELLSDVYDVDSAYGDYYVWSKSDGMSIQLYLEEIDYVAALWQGNRVHLDSLGIDSYEVEVYLGETYITTLRITDDNNGEYLYFSIPAEAITAGVNTLRFVYDSWSPSDYGGEDTRRFGLAFRYLQLAHASDLEE